MCFELNVEEFISRWPCAAQAFVRYGMACVGCEMGRFETVREAAGVYGITIKEFTTAIAQACESQMDGEADAIT